MANIRTRMAGLIPTHIQVNDVWVAALSQRGFDGQYHSMVFYALCPREEIERQASYWNIETRPLGGFIIAHDGDYENFALCPAVDETVIATLRELIDRAMRAVMSLPFSSRGGAVPVGEFTLVLTVDAFRDVIANFDSRQIFMEWEQDNDIAISVADQKPPSRPILRLNHCEVTLAALEYPGRPGMRAWVQYGDYVVAGWDGGGVQLLTERQS